MSGNLVQTVHPDGSLTRTVYDINNRPIVSQSEYMPTVQTSAGELEVSDSGGTRTVYDGFGRVHFTETLLKVLIAIQLFLTTFANAERTSREQIDDAGRRRLTQDVIPNSSSTTLQREFRHGYVSGGRLATESAYSILNPSSTTAAGAAVSYTVNPFGNRTKRDIAIHSAQDPGYSGKVGGVATYSYDNQDKLTGYTGNSTFSWDSGGNVVNTGTGYTYTHDRRNRLRQSTGPTVTAIMAYDPTGIRVKKTVGTTTTLYLVDSINPTGYAQVLCEYQYTTGTTATPTIQRTYSYGPDLISDNKNGTRQYYSVDALGTTRFVTSSASTTSLAASITAQFHYDAFGTLLGPGTEAATPYLYTGEQWDGDVGAYYLRARWYSVGLGRLLERDSYEGDDSEPISRNRYTYSHDNPVNGSDPTGHEFNLVGMMSGLGLGEILQTGKAFRDTAVQAELRGLNRDLLNDLSPRDLPGNLRMGLEGEVVWTRYLNTVGFKAVQASQSIGANGPDVFSAAMRNRRYHIVIGEVKASKSYVPGVAALR